MTDKVWRINSLYYFKAVIKNWKRLRWKSVFFEERRMNVNDDKNVKKIIIINVLNRRTFSLDYVYDDKFSRLKSFLHRIQWNILM